MMRVFKVTLITLVVCLVSILSLSCASDSASMPEGQVVAVQRGDLTIDITAVGNLAFSHQEELTFRTGGTVGEVLVEVGDRVEEEQVLARLDDASIISLQKAVIQAKLNLRNAESAEDLAITQAEAAVVDARIALEAAQEALEKAEIPYTEADIARAELAVINAEIALDKAQDNFERAEEKYNWNPTVPEWIHDYEQKKAELAIAEFDLAEAEETLTEMKTDADPLEVEQKQKQLAIAQANLKEAEDELVSMLGIELKQSEVVSAQAALDEAIEQLEMTTMAAPFAGIITSVNVEAGEAVNANQIAIELVDTDRFETEILVSETDIFNVGLGAQATVQIDSMSTVSLPAEVTFISPTATIQQGVVNYRVKVEVESLEATMLERQEAIHETMPDISSGEIPERMQEAIEQGIITQEQIDEMMEMREQMQAGEMPFQPGTEWGDVSSPQESGQLPTITFEDFQLREGLTVTVSIIVDERNDVLLVPNSAITSSGRQTYVKVVLPDGTIEDRRVTTGISDWQYTEIVEGLSEGDNVFVPEGTTTTSTTSTPQPGGEIRFFGPIGR